MYIYVYVYVFCCNHGKCVVYITFAGNSPPYHITQPPTDNYEQIVSPTATMTSITCALNITITRDILITWYHNNSFVSIPSPSGKTTTLVIRNLQPSHLGVYECTFIDTINDWRLRRTTMLGK